MAFGSKRWFPYTDDKGQGWAIECDESNVELLNIDADTSFITTGTYKLPSDFTKRTVKLKEGGGGTKTIPILDRDTFDGIVLGGSYSAPAVGEENSAGTSFVVVQKIPERRKRSPINLDTGKIDGDQP